MDDSHFRANAALIDDSNAHDFEPPTIDGHKFCTGLAPRDYDAHPMFANGKEFPDELLLDEHDLKAAFDDQLGHKSSLFDLREHAGGYLDSLDQDGLGLCWYFNVCKMVMYARKRAGLPDVPLSPWWGAGKINHWADRGGYCERGLAHASEFGLPRLDLCPRYKREFDTPEVDKAALDHLVEEFWETSRDREKRNHQYLTAMALGYAAGGDYDSLGHSMASCRIVNYQGMGSYDADADNSWTMKSGVKGLYRLKGRKACPDACVITRISKATNK